jgi:hypothetical protein
MPLAPGHWNHLLHHTPFPVRGADRGSYERDDHFHLKCLLLAKAIAKPEVKEVLAVVSLEVTHFVDPLVFLHQPLLSSV